MVIFHGNRMPGARRTARHLRGHGHRAHTSIGGGDPSLVRYARTAVRLSPSHWIEMRVQQYASSGLRPSRVHIPRSNRLNLGTDAHFNDYVDSV
jgi:hypothetical protein